MAVDNGFQACLMAPTEILASQHYESISELVAPIGIHVELLTGSTRKRERERIHEGLLTGDVYLIIGAHRQIEYTDLVSIQGLEDISETQRDAL